MDTIVVTIILTTKLFCIYFIKNVTICVTLSFSRSIKHYLKKWKHSQSTTEL